MRGNDEGKCPLTLFQVNFPDSYSRINLHFRVLKYVLLKYITFFEYTRLPLICFQSCLRSYYRRAAEGTSQTIPAMGTSPDFVELFCGGIKDRGVVCQDASLKVSLILSFHSDAGSGKVG